MRSGSAREENDKCVDDDTWWPRDKNRHSGNREQPGVLVKRGYPYDRIFLLATVKFEMINKTNVSILDLPRKLPVIPKAGSARRRISTGMAHGVSVWNDERTRRTNSRTRSTCAVREACVYAHVHSARGAPVASIIDSDVNRPE